VEENAYIGGVIAGLAYLVAGIRLYALSLRTREVPERLLAASFFYFFTQLPIVLDDESMVRSFSSMGYALSNTAYVPFALFLQRVFRGRERWALRLVVAIAISQIIGLGSSVVVGDWAGAKPLSNLWWWVDWTGHWVTVAWMGIEGFVQYVKARQRRRLDLCDPLVCNRYLLWGLTGATWVIYEIALLAQLAEFEITGTWSASMDALTGALESGAIALVWCVFFPPRIYQRWIDRTALATTPGEG
jgi:hypothetical protein